MPHASCPPRRVKGEVVTRAQPGPATPSGLPRTLQKERSARSHQTDAPSDMKVWPGTVCGRTCSFLSSAAGALYLDALTTPSEQRTQTRRWRHNGSSHDAEGEGNCGADATGRTMCIRPRGRTTS